jgi:hypothetical protein
MDILPWHLHMNIMCLCIYQMIMTKLCQEAERLVLGHSQIQVRSCCHLQFAELGSEGLKGISNIQIFLTRYPDCVSRFHTSAAFISVI